MTIKFLALEDLSAADHAEHVENLLNQGWERVFSHVDSQREKPFISYLRRGTIDGTVSKASVLEVLERRVKRVERLIRQIESLMQGSIDDEAVPTAWLEDQMQMYKTVKMAGNSQFIPLGDIYAEVLAEADAEDALREGNHG